MQIQFLHCFFIDFFGVVFVIKIVIRIIIRIAISSREEQLEDDLLDDLNYYEILLDHQEHQRRHEHVMPMKKRR